MRRVLLALGMIGALALTGCSAAAEPAAEVETSSELGKVTTIDQLVDAYVAAGGVCNWEQTDVITKAVASGTCRTADAAFCDLSTDWSILSMYATEGARDEIVNNVTTGDCPVSLLVGPNWVINASDAAEVADALGGDLRTK